MKNHLKNKLKLRISKFVKPEKMNAAKLALHTIIGVGTVTRCVRVALSLGRPVTPFDLGIMASAVVFEALRAEVLYRLIRN